MGVATCNGDFNEHFHLQTGDIPGQLATSPTGLQRQCLISSVVRLGVWFGNPVVVLV